MKKLGPCAVLVALVLTTPFASAKFQTIDQKRDGQLECQRFLDSFPSISSMARALELLEESFTKGVWMERNANGTAIARNDILRADVRVVEMLSRQLEMPMNEVVQEYANATMTLALMRGRPGHPTSADRLQAAQAEIEIASWLSTSQRKLVGQQV